MYLLIVFASSVPWFGKICRDVSRDCEVFSNVFLAAQFIRRYIHVSSPPTLPETSGTWSYSIFLRAKGPWHRDHISALKPLPAHHQGENPLVILRLRCCSFVFAILGTHKLQSTGDVRTEQHRSTPPCHQSNVEGAGRFQHGNNIYYTVYYIIRGRMYCNRIYRIYVYTIGCWVTRCICRLLRAKYINKWSYWRFLE